MPAQPVLVLFDRRGHFDEREDDGGGWGRGQGRVSERGGAERMRQDLGPARQEAPRGGGKAGGGRRASAVAVMLDRLALVVAMAAGAVQGFLPVLRCRRLSGRHDKPRVIARGHDFRLDDDTPRLRPRGRGRGAASETRVLGGGGAPEACALAVRGWKRRRAAGMTGAAWRRSTGGPARPPTPSLCRRWAITARPSGGAQGLAPRTRRGGVGPWRRREARRRTTLIAWSAPGGRVPGRRKAASKAGEVPAHIHSAREPSRWE